MQNKPLIIVRSRSLAGIVSGLFFISVIIQACFSVRSNKQFKYHKLRAPEYDEYLSRQSQFYLIDVRTSKEFNKSHLPDARHFNYLNRKFSTAVDSLNRDIPVFIYCQTCHRSPLAAKILKKKGFKEVIDLKKGYASYNKFNGL